MEAKINPQMLILAREIRGLSQTELATETEISQSRLSKYEADITPIPSNELDVLRHETVARTYQCTQIE